MIINIRGGCGAGKSTIVKQIINELGVERDVCRDGRLKPRGYVLNKKVFVPGHYEIQNGGLDTIGNLPEAYGLIEEFAVAHHVLYEGMNQKADVSHVVRLSLLHMTSVIVLNTPYDDCLASFRAKGQRRDEKYVERTHRKANRDAIALENLGIHARMLNRAEALAETRRLLCLT